MHIRCSFSDLFLYKSTIDSEPAVLIRHLGVTRLAALHWKLWQKGGDFMRRPDYDRLDEIKYTRLSFYMKPMLILID